MNERAKVSGFGPKPAVTAKRAEVVATLEHVTKALCEYYHDFSCEKPLGFCDCKYGSKNVMANVRPDDIDRHAFGGARQGEQTGCPELRLAMWVINNMTDAEFEAVLRRQQKGLGR